LVKSGDIKRRATIEAITGMAAKSTRIGSWRQAQRNEKIGVERIGVTISDKRQTATTEPRRRQRENSIKASANNELT